MWCPRCGYDTTYGHRAREYNRLDRHGCLFGEFTFQYLAGHGIGLGYFLALQPFALKHVHEVGVATEVELVGAVDANTSVFEQAGEHAVGDGCPNLALDVVADNGNAALQNRNCQ